MALVALGIKLNRDFQTMDSIELDQLAKDCKAWEADCLPDSENQFKRLYFKLFKENPIIRLGVALCYFPIVSYLKGIFTDKDDFDDDFTQD